MHIDSVELARRCRAHALRMTHRVNASHIGACLSMADILAVLYRDVVRIDPQRPTAPDRDRVIVSKGHAAAIVYAVLAERGFFPVDWLERYCDDDQPLAGHVSHHGVPGVEVSTGALGHGLPLACGFAMAARAQGRSSRVYALLSDGECDEGSVWEAILFAGHQNLGHLTAVIDRNRLQGFGRTEDVLDLEPFADKWRAFGWQVVTVDGHDHDSLRDAFAAAARDTTRPSVVLAETIKGKGVGFMENTLEWHYRSVNQEQLAAALAGLESER